MNIMNQITFKGLKKNRTRTIVTIIGVILSTAMITAVTTFASSFQNYLLNYAIVRTGDWHLKVDLNNTEDYKEIQKDESLKEISVTRDGGYSLLPNSMNEYKPYLHILELNTQAIDSLPLHLTSGRLPESGNEVVISNHIYDNGGIQYKLGQEIELEVGNRYVDGYILGQNNPYNHEEDGKGEEFISSTTRTFTVVGFMERFPYEVEGFSAPGYSIITKMDEPSIASNDKENLSLYLKLKTPRNVYDLEYDYVNKYDIEYSSINNDLLRYQGVSDIDGFNGVLFGLSAIVISLIVVGSVSLIYNSFSISVSERKKQFGLLSSVGATRKQLMNSVFFEAMVIATVGIPLGIGSGILGIGITLYQLKDNFSKMFADSIPVELTLSVSVLSIVAAIIFSLITILISAYIPANRTKKASAIDAVRQTSDIKLTARRVKTSFLTRKIFGFEGDLALKNLKRNKKRYRSTVLSLFISVLLFISASAFSMYLTDSIENVYEDYNFDICYTMHDYENLHVEYLKAYNEIKNLDSITDSSIIRNGYGETKIKEEYLKADFFTEMVEGGMENDENGLLINIVFYSMDHENFLSYLDDLNLSKDKFLNPDEITAIAIDKQHYFDNDAGRYINSNILKSQDSFTIELKNYSESSKTAAIKLGAFADKTPIGIEEHSPSQNSIQLILDEETIQASDNNIKDMEWSNEYMFLKSDNPALSFNEMEKILDSAGLNSGSIFNVAEEVEANRNIITILNVFAYGFIILMSLITIANVFNTITTNINLRKREFAMLKSVGMTNKSFHKMLNYESIFYGLKALLYGIPSSMVVTFLIYLSIQQGLDTSFYLPIKSIIISVFSVFLVVFISMMYSTTKIQKENILDALKNENL